SLGACHALWQVKFCHRSRGVGHETARKIRVHPSACDDLLAVERRHFGIEVTQDLVDSAAGDDAFLDEEGFQRTNLRCTGLFAVAGIAELCGHWLSSG